MEQKKIYHVRAKFSIGNCCERWCFDKKSRDRYISEVKAASGESNYVVEIQQYTYVLKGEKIEYCVPEIQREKE